MEATEKKSFMDDLGKIPNKVQGEFKTFSLIKKLFIVWAVYYVIERLTKQLDFKKEDITENVLELPKKVWSNFWGAPTGSKFLMVLLTWYVVKNLFPNESK